MALYLPSLFLFLQSLFSFASVCLLLPIFFFLLQALAFLDDVILDGRLDFSNIWYGMIGVLLQRSGTDVLFSMIPIAVFGLHPGKVSIRPDFVLIFLRVGAV